MVLGAIVALVLAVVSFILSELLRPVPNIENAKPADLGEFQFPTATEGRVVPLVWGTVRLQGPNVVWYGDFRQVPIKESIRVNIFRKKTFTTGYQYFFGMQLAACRGPIDYYGRLWVGETLFFTMNAQSGDRSFENLGLFGGDLGSGGMRGDMSFHHGSETQTIDSYLSGFQTTNPPAYRGTAYILWKGPSAATEQVNWSGYHGTSTSIKPWKIEVSRWPNTLGLTSERHKINTENFYYADANPACVLYEVLTNDEWGFGYPSGDIDVSNFQSVGNTLWDEQNGFSIIVDAPMEASEIIKMIENQIDGVVYLDQESGKFKIALARNDYDIDTVPQIGAANILEIKEFARGTWSETVNHIRVEYTDRHKGYFKTYGQAHDLANQRSQGGQIISSTIKYPGVKDKTLANWIAARDLKGLSRPLAKASLIVDRSFWNIKPLDVIAWSDETLDFTKLPMRVLKVDFGSLRDGKIELQLVEDVFEFASPYFGDPTDSLWVDPDQDLEDEIPATQSKVIEAPWALIRRDPDIPGTADRLWVAGRHQNDPSVYFKIYERNAVGTPSGDYSEAGSIDGFMLIGTLRTTIDHGSANPLTVQVDASPDTLAVMQDAFTASPAKGDIGQNLINLIMIEDEFLAVTTVTNQTTHLDLGTTYRGLLDSVPVDHTAGVSVYLVCAGAGLSDATIPQTNNVDVQLRSVSRSDEITEGEADTIQLTMANRTSRPYAPVEPTVNGTRYEDPVDVDDLKSGGSGLEDRGIETDFYRRDYRNLDEVQSLEQDAADIIGDFPTYNDHENRIELVEAGESLSTSLDAYWKLEETAGSTRLDETSNDVDLADNNTVAQITGKIGQGAGFTATSSHYLEAATAGELDYGDEDFSLACWVKLTTKATDQVLLSKWGENSDERQYKLSYDTSSDRFRFSISSAGTSGTVTSVDADTFGAVSTGIWYFVVGRHDATLNTIDICVNAGIPDVAPHSGGSNSNTDLFRMGVEEVGGSLTNYLDGNLDAAGAWNKVLTLAEISSLYAAGTGQEHPFATRRTLATVAWGTLNSGFISRTEIAGAAGGSLPDHQMKLVYAARHTFEETVYEALTELEHDFAWDTSDLDAWEPLGVVASSTATKGHIASATGTYNFEIGTALGGDVEGRINGGSWTQVIAASSVTGTLAGVTAGDELEFQHLDSASPPDRTILLVKTPTPTTEAYAILIPS